MPAATVLLNLLRRHIVNKSFPQYSRPYGHADAEFYASLKKRVAALVGHQANFTIVNSADNIVLSAFKGVKVVGVYGNYYMIYKAVDSMVKIFTTSFQAGVGNSLVVDDDEKIYGDFRTLSYLTAFVVGIACTAFLCMIQNFIFLWQGDKGMLPSLTAVLFTFSLLLTQMRRVIVIYKNAAGMWWEDRYKPYAVALCDLIIDLVFVGRFGINAVIVSTIVSVLFIETPWEIIVLFRYKFRRPAGGYFIRLSIYFGVIIFFAAVAFGICGYIPQNSLGSLLIRMMVSVLVPAAGYCLVSFRTYEFRRLSAVAVGMIRRIR
jgi:O-antigen/teichoic acid export membrane protein